MERMELIRRDACYWSRATSTARPWKGALLAPEPYLSSTPEARRPCCIALLEKEGTASNPIQVSCATRQGTSTEQPTMEAWTSGVRCLNWMRQARRPCCTALVEDRTVVIRTEASSYIMATYTAQPAEEV